jgi:ADP-heptose:LPS heptosyltransferase
VAPADVPAVFFESRSYGAGSRESLGALAARWADGVFDTPPSDAYPRVWLEPAALDAAARLLAALRGASARRVTAVNLGVGGNPRKRIGGTFELELVRALLAGGGAIVLDRGIGEEQQRVGDIVAALRGQGLRIAEVAEARFRDTGGALDGADVLVYEGGIGPFAALTGGSDAYVGYDSAFQHIAAALAVPVIDVFVDAPSPLFADRWKPHSRAPVHVVPGGGTPAEVVDAVRAIHRTLPA